MYLFIINLYERILFQLRDYSRPLRPMATYTHLNNCKNVLLPKTKLLRLVEAIHYNFISIKG